jgi:alpha-N-arabinofuranosidase
MEMYNVHQGATRMPVQVNASQYVLGNDSLPAVSASASKDAGGLTHVSLVNIDPGKPQHVTINFSGAGYRQVSGRILVSQHVQDYNTFAEPDKIKPAPFTGAQLKNQALQVSLPPASVVVLELK